MGRCAALLVLALLAIGTAGRAQEEPERLRVGIAHAPPYTILGKDGTWHGMNVSLWNRIATAQDLDFDWVVDDQGDPVAQVLDGRADISIAPVSVDAAAERQIDFSYPYSRDGFGIAIREDRWQGVIATLRAISSLEFALTMGLLSLLALVAGTVIWLLERWRNGSSFARTARPGVGDGFWWAVVTMTTVGYGDKAPITPPGRIVATFWMYAALILTAVATAQLTARISHDTRGFQIVELEDLTGLRVAVLPGGGAREELSLLGATVVPVDDFDQAFGILEDNTADAFVANREALKWYASSKAEISLLGLTIGFNDYAFVLPEDWTLRNTINVSLLNVIAHEDWRVSRDQ